MDWDSVHFTYLKNLYWVAVVAIQCIVTTLAYGFRSTPLRIKFLEVLIKCNFSADLPGKMYARVYMMRPGSNVSDLFLRDCTSKRARFNPSYSCRSL